MAVSIEDILLARAQQEQTDGLTGVANGLSQAMPYVGGIGGAVVGGAVGEGQMELMSRLKSRVTDESMGARIRRGVTPGHRMAGGLVGAILGGALGTGAKQAMTQDSPSASLLAKLQTTGSLNTSEQMQLQSILADTYSNIVG